MPRRMDKTLKELVLHLFLFIYMVENSGKRPYFHDASMNVQHTKLWRPIFGTDKDTHTIRQVWFRLHKFHCIYYLQQ